jgi:hypothetical protein
MSPHILTDSVKPVRMGILSSEYGESEVNRVIAALGALSMLYVAVVALARVRMYESYKDADKVRGDSA